MKIAFLLLLICTIYTSNAQKTKTEKSAVVSPNAGVVANLPDLQFLNPPLLTSEKVYYPRNGVPNEIVIPTQLFIINNGNTISKAYKVEVRILYPGIRTRTEIEHGDVPEGSYNRSVTSNQIDLAPLANGRIIEPRYSFQFVNFPEEAWGKRVKFVFRIIYPEPNKEISSKNNEVQLYEFPLNKY
jgi:hypothetical protein